ncbi:MAG TPA: HlyD family efflux transporter periplasmic adaptor subunit [Rhizomicrobium sp.]
MAIALTLLARQAVADNIGGTGHIEPSGGIVLLDGVAGARILAIPVRPGQLVKRGDLLMTLDDREQRENEQIAELTLIQATRDASQNLAAEAVSLKISAERWRNAQNQADSYKAMGPEATSQIQMSNFNQAAEEARLQLGVEQKKERQIRDDNAANVASASRRLEIERQRLALYRLVAPSDGTILKIDQHVGENVGGGTVIEMGDIRTMYVICQAFQGDLLKLKPGMRATIKNNAFRNPLKGVVENVGRLVDTKAQLGDVRIKLNDPKVASKVVGMEVEVEIER